MPSYRGELGLPNKHAIAAAHQGAADSNAALPRRERGAANAEAWQGESRLLRAATAASTTPRLAVQRQGEQFFKSVLSDAHWSAGRVRVL